MNFTIKELNELIYSLGTTASKGRFVNKDVNASLLDRIYDELNRRIDSENYISESKIDYALNKVLGDANSLNDKIRSHFVTNEEADEDYRSTLEQDEYRYEAPKKERGWIVQAMLDYVDTMGARTHGQMENYYKFITNGSNSFSHCLINLKVPYKNRKTQRYLVKEGRRGSNAKWVVKVANPSNWVENEY